MSPSTDIQSQAESKQKSGHIWKVSINGNSQPPQQVLYMGVIEDNLRLPDMCVLTYHDPTYALGGTVKIGNTLVVKAHDSENAAGEELFNGVVTALEALLEAGKSYVIVRAL